MKVLCHQYTVNAEIIARVLFSKNLAHAEFCENKPFQNGEINLLFTNIGKSCSS